MAAVFHQRTISVNNKNIQAKWYEVSPGEMTIQTAGSDLTTFGTNASFFWEDGNVMTAMHVVNGQAVYNGGLNNYADASNPSATKMSCLYCQFVVLGGSAGYAFGLLNQAQTYSDVPQPSNGSVVWAIGGITLLANETRTSDPDMIARYRQVYTDYMVDGTPQHGSWIPGLGDDRARTFIGYNPSSDKIVFGVLSLNISGTSISDVGVTYHDMHLILKNTLGCSLALNVDGGGSSKVKYKNSTGQTIEAEVGPRNVLCQLALTSSAAANCNWNGT